MPGRGRLHPADDVAGADHERDLDAARLDLDDLVGERLDPIGIDAVRSRSPISASPESFRRTRRNGAGLCERGLVALATRLL